MFEKTSVFWASTTDCSLNFRANNSRQNITKRHSQVFPRRAGVLSILFSAKYDMQLQFKSTLFNWIIIRNKSKRHTISLRYASKGWVETARLQVTGPKSLLYAVFRLKDRTSQTRDTITRRVFLSLTITWIDKNDLHCVCVGIQSNESPPLPWHVFFFRHLAATLFSWSHNYMSIWGRIFTDKYNFFATQINVVLFTKLGTHIATDNLIGVESLHFGFQLTKIPYQGAHASWQSVHAIHKMT